MATSNKGIYISIEGEISIRSIDEQYVPKERQSLIRVEYSAVNPADIKHHYMGLSGSIAGYEWVGEVIAVGPDSPHAVGGHLFGMSVPGHKRHLWLGAHQNYLLAEPEFTTELPPGLDSQVAVSFPMSAWTSIDALFNKLGYSFPAAGLDKGFDPTDEPILIWGGASAVGQAGIQLARKAGFSPIITTASAHQHEALKKLGADHCFDYHEAAVVESIRSVVKDAKKPLRTVYDTVSAGMGFGEDLTDEEIAKVNEKFDQSSPALARKCCDGAKEALRLVATLPVSQDPDWGFPLPYRLRQGERRPSNPGIQPFFEGVDLETGERLTLVQDWLLKDGGKNWTPMPLKVSEGAEAGVQAIKDAYAGKSGGYKYVIKRPL
jgi:D-arabinose 1-dehydrogenase-like Zn-dependent alcohol dehydrogenase